jgi:hypothetical protein
MKAALVLWPGTEAYMMANVESRVLSRTPFWRTDGSVRQISKFGLSTNWTESPSPSHKDVWKFARLRQVKVTCL